MEVPVKVEHNNAWHPMKMGVDESGLTLGPPVNLKIALKSVVDIVEKGNVLILSLKDEKNAFIRFATVDQVRAALKRILIQHCSAYRLVAYFISPAIKGGVLNTSATWEKGAIAVLKTTFWFVNQGKQICIPLSAITGIEMTRKDVQGKEADVIKIDHLEGQELTTSFVLCPISTLQILFNYLQDSLKGLDVSSGEIDPLASQVAMLVYSGMDSAGIEKMLSLSPSQLEKITDTLLNAGIAEVICIRRELRLTPKGVRFISESLKSATN